MRDTTGISLSVSDPNNENPLPETTGFMEEAEDYCSSELVYGDRIASMLNVQANRSPAAALTRGAAPAMRHRRTANNMRYVLLAGAVVAVFVALTILSGRKALA